MSRSAYPLDTDISAYLASIGAQIPAAFSATGYAQMAVDEWELSTGYIPFLGQSSSDQTRLYSPSDLAKGSGPMILDLGVGLYGLTSVTVGVNVGSPGTVLTQGVEFWLEPAEAPNQGQPYERIRFGAHRFLCGSYLSGWPQSIQIVGRFGWGATIPERVWQAIVRRGAAIAIKDLADSSLLQSIEWHDGEESEASDPNSLIRAGQNGTQFFEDAVMAYKRVTF